MAQFYTLEEAARVLGMSPEELKAKAQSREVRAFLDGGSWRFRVVDVDELARRRGMGSDAELRLSDLDVPVAIGEEGSSADDALSEYNMGVNAPDLGPPTLDLPHVSDTGSEHDLLIEDLTLPPGPVGGSSSVIIGMHHGGAKLPSDSDVRLVPDNPKGASDSDVQLASAPKGPSDSDIVLAGPGSKLPSDSDVTLIADDTSDHDIFAASSSSDTAVRQSPVLGSSAEHRAIDEEDSDFELTPSSVMDALHPDSGSDFELSALEEPSDEFEATPLSGPSDSDVTAADPGFSGINLSRPSDSGINLQGASGFNLASSIELAPLSASDIKPAPKPAVPPPAAAAPGKAKPGLSATPSPAARQGEKDIFDDTDFEVDAFDVEDSEDKTMQLEAASDFDLEESDTGSEVFAIDEEDVDQNAATAMGPATFEEEEEDEVDPFEAASGEMANAWDVESEGAAPAERAAPAAVLATAGPQAEWGGLWIGFLAVATVFMLFLAFVSVDLVRNLYEFRGDGPGSGIIKGIAGLLGG